MNFEAIFAGILGFFLGGGVGLVIYVAFGYISDWLDGGK